ncbi:MAG: hypothetical protein PHR90_10150 [Sphaerochaetaceae bacterium]|nr:hypothetical protein [Sphaerochaetaceae bacterium]MDD3942821.1 hypothetical protein [Sphaerochaetaceae bacterium]
MRTKIMIIAAFILVLSVGVVSAEVPSVFEVNVLNYYTIQDLADTDFATYTPGVRMALFITEWFGLSGEALLLEPFSGVLPNYSLLVTTDLVFRWPLGFFEMFGALGPAYDLTVNSGGITLPAKVKYSGRIGFDFNITPLFCVGIEAKHLLPDLSGLVAGTQGFDLLGDTFVGLGLKLKL